MLELLLVVSTCDVASGSVLGGCGVGAALLGVPGVLWSVAGVLEGVMVELGAAEFEVPVVSVEFVVVAGCADWSVVVAGCAGCAD